MILVDCEIREHMVKISALLGLLLCTKAARPVQILRQL